MILAEKIMHLRKKNGWSQEELAGKLNVSRQSVSKWESAMSVPDLDKILLMSEIFEVSTDYLLKDDRTEEDFVSGNPDGEETRKITMEEAQHFLKVRRDASAKIASGVAACILSPVLLLFLGGAAESGMLDMSEDLAAGIGMMAVLLIVAAAGVWLFVSAGIIQGSFRQLLQEGDYTVEAKRTGKIMDKIAPVYWCLVTAGYVGYSLWTWTWTTSWIVWPVAGILYGALAGAVRMWKKK